MSRLERLIFFGTPDFALPTLQALVSAGRAPLLVVTQPDRPAGRGQRVQAGAVARWAREQGFEVWQPAKVREPEAIARVAELKPDVAIVAAFGQIFPRALLDLPRHGCINVHASLLPRHRGAAPVQAALLAGDAETGVSIMRMEEGLDTGPVLLQQSTTIFGGETAGELAARLAHLGAALLLAAVAAVEAGRAVASPQPDLGASYAPRLQKDQGRVDWSEPAAAVDRRVRAMSPWPGVTLELAGKPLKLLRGRALGERSDAAPGTLIGLADGALRVACGGGSVFGILRAQRPGRRPVAAADLVHGEHLAPGLQLR